MTTHRATAVAMAVDVVCVLVFAFAGRDAHDEGSSILTVLRIAWPFLVALAVGWMLVLARSLLGWRVWPDATVILVVTYMLGMVLRGLSGRGLAPAFLIVAFCFLTATLLGWRLVVAGVRLFRSRQASR